MSASVIAFARDLFAELEKLKTFDSQPTVHELLHRHERVGQLMDEGIGQRDRGILDWRKLEIIIHAWRYFNRYCLLAGVDQNTVEAFNKERPDWKYFRSLPGRL